jgi:hypothetical protein
MNRERDERMTETFVAVHDALVRAPVPSYQVVMGKMPRLSRPSYLPQAPAQTPAQYTAALAKLGKLGIVKVN